MVAISTIVAPIIAGTLTIREYFTAYERVMPPITHAEIVEPRRERPGIVEKPWKNPAISASFGFKFFCVFSPSGSISATTSRIAVRYRPTPGASRFEEVSVTSSESCRRLQQSGWWSESAGKQAYGSCCRVPSGTAFSPDADWKSVPLNYETDRL